MRMVLAVPYGLMCATLAANLWYLLRRRQRRPPPGDRRVSVLIPARNEERNLRRLLPSLLCQRQVEFEIIIYDDASTDGTAAVAAGTGDGRVRTIVGAGPPPGWVGKVHALYQASRHASGDVFLFLDADTVLKHDGALANLLSRFAALPPQSVLTAVPHFRGGGALLVSGIAHGMLTNLPLPLVPLLRSKYVAAMNGQCWMISREDYRAHEPHLGHPQEVLEDIRIGRYLCGRGVIPRFEDVQDDLEVWMYDGFRSAWRGFRKNAFLLTGRSRFGFATYLGAYVAVYLLAPLASIWFPVIAITTKLVSDRYARYPLWVSLLAPATFVFWAVLFVDSAMSHMLGTVRWKGRLVGDRSLLRR
jgi:glycosyltransferase involved in cell wall biosynthesis